MSTLHLERLQAPTPKDFEFLAVISAIEDFFARPVYSGLGPAIEQKKKHMALLFFVVRRMARITAGNCLLLALAIMFYSKVRKPEGKKRIFQLALSENNVRVLERVNKILRDSGIGDISMNGHRVRLYERFQILLPIGNLIDVARALTKGGDENPFIHLQKTLGCASLLLFSRLIKKEELDIVCVANDHAPVCIALLHVARSLGLRTCYVQHAPVTQFFPKLNYDISVLFDRASEEAYQAGDQRWTSKCEGKITFLPPFDDSFKMVSVGPKPYKIGICLSFLPRIDRLQGLISDLAQSGEVTSILLRRHPRCNLDLSALTSTPKATVQPKGRTLQDFLEAVDLVLVPNSGVAVEALHSGKPTFFTLGMDKVADDYYGFVGRGVLPVFDFRYLNHPEELLAIFSIDWQKRFSMFDETVTTPLAVSHREVSRAFHALLSPWQADRGEGLI